MPSPLKSTGHAELPERHGASGEPMDLQQDQVFSQERRNAGLPPTSDDPPRPENELLSDRPPQSAFFNTILNPQPHAPVGGSSSGGSGASSSLHWRRPLNPFDFPTGTRSKELSRNERAAVARMRAHQMQRSFQDPGSSAHQFLELARSATAGMKTQEQSISVLKSIILSNRNPLDYLNGERNGELNYKQCLALNRVRKHLEGLGISPEDPNVISAWRKRVSLPPASPSEVHVSGETPAPKREPSMPPEIHVPANVLAHGSAANLNTYTERPIDMGRTEFVPGQQEAFNVDTDTWEPMIAENAAGRLLVRHSMEPDRKQNFAWPMRAIEHPIDRVDPLFSDEWGYLHPAVQFVQSKNPLEKSVVSHFSVTGALNFINSRTSGINLNHAELKAALAGVRHEVETELTNLMANSRANAPDQFFPSLLDQRTYTRRVQPGDIADHEKDLLAQYGLFARPDQVVPKLRNGRIIGIYMGSVLRGEAEEERAIEAHGDDHARYLLAAPHGRSGAVTNYSGAGAINNTGIANTATRADLKDYDKSRINAVFLPFEIRLTDNRGMPRVESVSVLVGLDNLEPGKPILVNYGPIFLQMLQRASARDLRAAEREKRNNPRPIKAEPSEQPLLPTGPVRYGREDYADYVVGLALGQDLREKKIGRDFYDKSIRALREAIGNNPDIDNLAWIVEQTLLERREQVKQDYQGYFDKMIRAAQGRAG